MDERQRVLVETHLAEDETDLAAEMSTVIGEQRGDAES